MDREWHFVSAPGPRMSQKYSAIKSRIDSWQKKKKCGHRKLTTEKSTPVDGISQQNDAYSTARCCSSFYLLLVVDEYHFLYEIIDLNTLKSAVRWVVTP